jgi:hypothetical protein
MPKGFVVLSAVHYVAKSKKAESQKVACYIKSGLTSGLQGGIVSAT